MVSASTTSLVVLKNGPGTGENISVSWPVTTSVYHSRDLRQDIFREAVRALMKGFGSGEEALQSPLCVHVLTTCFTELPYNFPFNAMQDFVFVSSIKLCSSTYIAELTRKDECRRRELLEQGILRQVLLLAVHYDAAAVDLPIRLRFRGRIVVEHSNPWNILCRVSLTVSLNYPVSITLYLYLARKGRKLGRS
jgi:hypothetical protein